MKITFTKHGKDPAVLVLDDVPAAPDHPVTFPAAELAEVLAAIYDHGVKAGKAEPKDDSYRRRRGGFATDTGALTR